MQQNQQNKRKKAEADICLFADLVVLGLLAPEFVDELLAVAFLHVSSAHLALRKRHSFFECLSLCLSRACLGKMMIVLYTTGTTVVFLYLHAQELWHRGRGAAAHEPLPGLRQVPGIK
jgi:hypothetical protein